MAKPKTPKAPAVMPPPERRVTICVIGAPHGVRGQCRVKSFTADPMAIADYGTLFSDKGRAFEIDDGRHLKDDMLVVSFEGITDRDVIKAFTGTELFVDRANLPDDAEEDEFYHADLVGLDVVDLDGAPVGTVHLVQNYGAGDILEVRPAEAMPAEVDTGFAPGMASKKSSGGPTWLVPFTKAAVPKVDIKARRVEIDPAHLMKPETRAAKPAEEPED
jgi:16S rRNA processing protein RimM